MSRNRIIVLLLITLSCLLFQQCGEIPPVMPEPVTGSLKVAASDPAVNSFEIHLDDIRLGLFPNPAFIPSIAAGIHKLLIITNTNVSSSQLVTITQNTQTTFLLDLHPEGTFIGQKAPVFTATTILNEQFSLESQRGKVVLLAIFEHT